MIMTWHIHLAKLLTSCGFTPEQAQEQAWYLVDFTEDPRKVEAMPYAILHHGGQPPMYSSAMNSERVRHVSGVTLVLNLPVIRAAFDEAQDNPQTYQPEPRRRA